MLQVFLFALWRWGRADNHGDHPACRPVGFYSLSGDGGALTMVLDYSNGSSKFLFALWRWGRADTDSVTTRGGNDAVFLFALWRWGRADFDLIQGVASASFYSLSGDGGALTQRSRAQALVVVSIRSLAMGAR